MKNEKWGMRNETTFLAYFSFFILHFSFDNGDIIASFFFLPGNTVFVDSVRADAVEFVAFAEPLVFEGVVGASGGVTGVVRDFFAIFRFEFAPGCRVLTVMLLSVDFQVKHRL